jgi:hypothetical protein
LFSPETQTKRSIGERKPDAKYLFHELTFVEDSSRDLLDHVSMTSDRMIRRVILKVLFYRGEVWVYGCMRTQIRTYARLRCMCVYVLVSMCVCRSLARALSIIYCLYPLLLSRSSLSHLSLSLSHSIVLTVALSFSLFRSLALSHSHSRSCSRPLRVRQQAHSTL